MIGWFKQNIQILKNRKMFDSNLFIHKNKTLFQTKHFLNHFSIVYDLIYYE